jgi:hypothetical protein
MRTLLVLTLLFPNSVFAAEYDLTRPVWDQRDKLNCVVEERLECTMQGTACFHRASGITPLPCEINFPAKSAGPKEPDDGYSQRKIVSEVLSPYPLLKTASNSLLLDDGRVFTLIYDQAQSKGAFYLKGYLMGASSRRRILVIEFNCF